MPDAIDIARSQLVGALTDARSKVADDWALTAREIDELVHEIAMAAEGLKEELSQRHDCTAMLEDALMRRGVL